MRLFQDTQERLALDRSLHGETRRILSYLLSVSDYQNRVPGPKIVSEKMQIHPSAISRAYGELKRVGVLIVTKGDFTLSPLLCWKGSQRGLEKACHELLATGKLLGPGSVVMATLPARLGS